MATKKPQSPITVGFTTMIPGLFEDQPRPNERRDRQSVSDRQPYRKSGRVKVDLEENAFDSSRTELVVRFEDLDEYSTRAIQRLAAELPSLVRHARQENYASRVSAILEAFAPPDPLADEQLRITQSDAEARSEFFERVPMLDSKQIALAAGHSNQNSAQTAYRWRNAGKIFAVPHGGGDYYPAFQFVDGQPLPVVAHVLKLFSAAEPPRTNWQNAFWFASANAWLGGAAPMDLLQSDPDRVIDAAEKEMAPRDY